MLFIVNKVVARWMDSPGLKIDSRKSIVYQSISNSFGNDQ